MQQPTRLDLQDKDKIVKWLHVEILTKQHFIWTNQITVFQRKPIRLEDDIIVGQNVKALATETLNQLK